jgi:hypothetical protein
MTHDRSFGQAPQASILRRWRWARREQASLDPEVETLDYERERFAYTPGGRDVVDAMLDDFAARLPAPVRALGRQTLLAAMDDHLRSTHRLGDPRGGAHTLAAGAGRAFAAAKRVPPDPSDRSWADHFRAPERHAELTSAGSG